MAIRSDAARPRGDALLRLGAEDLASFDAACRAAGMSRSAFARAHLVPLMAGLAERLPAIERARRARGQSLAAFHAAALDAALAPDVGAEFDALFG